MLKVSEQSQPIFAVEAPEVATSAARKQLNGARIPLSFTLPVSLACPLDSHWLRRESQRQNTAFIQSLKLIRSADLNEYSHKFHDHHECVENTLSDTSWVCSAGGVAQFIKSKNVQEVVRNAERYYRNSRLDSRVALRLGNLSMNTMCHAENTQVTCDDDGVCIALTLSGREVLLKVKQDTTQYRKLAGHLASVVTGQAEVLRTSVRYANGKYYLTISALAPSTLGPAGERMVSVDIVHPDEAIVYDPFISGAVYHMDVRAQFLQARGGIVHTSPNFTSELIANLCWDTAITRVRVSDKICRATLDAYADLIYGLDLYTFDGFAGKFTKPLELNYISTFHRHYSEE